jgi:hypothetical protein
MKNVYRPNALALNQRAQRTYHRFDFGQFGHRRVG